MRAFQQESAGTDMPDHYLTAVWKMSIKRQSGYQTTTQEAFKVSIQETFPGSRKVVWEIKRGSGESFHILKAFIFF